MSSIDDDGLCGVIHLNATSDRQVRCRYEFGHQGPHSWVSQVKVFEFCGLRMGGFYHSSTLDATPWERYDMLKYQLWGTEIESDVPVDVNDPDFKRKLVMLKVMIDRTGNLTGKFIIAKGKVRAYPDRNGWEKFKNFFDKKGEDVPGCYEDDLNSKGENPKPIYTGKLKIG